MFVDAGPPRPDSHVEALRRDLLLAPQRSDWSRRVTDERIKTTDRLRPFATRGLLLTGMVVLLALSPDVAWWVWPFLIPAVAQTLLEIWLENRMRASAMDTSGNVVLAGIVRFWYLMYERLPFNVTGLLGTLAVALNVIVAVLGTGPANPGGLKVAVLVLALLYANSGILGTLMDAPWFSPLSGLGGWVRALQPGFWVAATVIAVGLVLIGEVWGRWPEGSLPYALLSCGLGYYIGLRVRDYVRDMQAAARVHVHASLEEKAALALTLHDTMQPAKYGLPRVIHSTQLSGGQRAALHTMLGDIEELYVEARKGSVDSRTLLRTPFEHRVRQLLTDAAISYAGSRFDLDGRLDDPNHQFAKSLLTNLLQNARDAYAEDPFLLDAHVTVTMFLDDVNAHISVQDSLPPIPEAHFARTGSTLGSLREDLRARQGDLTQDIGSKGKTISARWSTVVRPLRDTKEE